MLPSGNSGGGMGGGRGQGQGRGQGGGRGRMGGFAAGPSGNCVCPQCGKTLPHQRAVPCNQTMCPNCKVAMVRE